MLKQEVNGQQMLKQKVKDQKVKEIRISNQKFLNQQGQDLSWKINKLENLIVFLIAFSLSTNKTYLLTWTKIINLF